MELWVRSQSRNSLAKVSGLFLRMVPNVTTEKLEYYIESPEFVLGCYKTEKRALEVLNEIEEKLCLLQAIELAKGNDITLIGFKNAIGEEKLNGLCFPYKMPKE